MDDLADLMAILDDAGRKVYVVEKLIDLTRLIQENSIYILELPGGSRAAGGRGGGFGDRRIAKAYHFEIRNGSCLKVVEVEEDSKLDALDLPLHATAMPAIGADGKERLVSGIVDPSFVEAYRKILG